MNRQVRKAEHIFDRARDWEGLVRFATADSAGVRLGIVSGRRRRGKTYLLAVKGATLLERDSLVIAGRASTLSWSIGPQAIR